MHPRQILTCALAALLAAGCASTRQVSYFEPAAVPGVTVTSPWSGLTSVADVRVEPGKLEVMLEDAPSSPRAKLLLWLPAGASVRLRDAAIVALPASGPPVAATVTKVQANVIEAGVGRLVDFAPDELLVGASVEVGSGVPRPVNVRRFEIVATFGGALPDRFSLVLPRLRVNGVDVVLPAIPFERKVGAAYDHAAP